MNPLLNWMPLAPHGHGHGHQGPGHQHGPDDGTAGPEARDQYGNPVDLASYVARLEPPERAEWQKPDEVVAALGLEPGQVVGEVGAGLGYFTLRFARAVGEGGVVFAAEVEPRILSLLRERLADSGLRNVVPILALAEDPLLPLASCDVIVVVNAFHHFAERTAYLERLKRALKPGGRLVNIDFHKREVAHGPPVDHKLAREDFLRHAEQAGLQVVDEPTFLPDQYFLVLRPKEPAKVG